MAPVTYKDRKDIGTQKKRETREQQPTQARGSTDFAHTWLSEGRKKEGHCTARIAARKSGGEVKKDTTSSRDKEKTTN